MRIAGPRRLLKNASCFLKVGTLRAFRYDLLNFP